VGAVVALVVILALASQCGADEEEPTARLSGTPATTAPRAVQPALAAPAAPSTTTARPTTTTPRPTTTSAAPEPQPAPKPAPKPAPAPEPEPKPEPEPEPEAESQPEPEPAADDDDGDVYYENCAAVRAAGAAPIRRGDPGYRRGLDSDGDGQGCGSD
jgi:outer membrane biosynthesis protein TonB